MSTVIKVELVFQFANISDIMHTTLLYIIEEHYRCIIIMNTKSLLLHNRKKTHIHTNTPQLLLRLLNQYIATIDTK